MFFRIINLSIFRKVSCAVFLFGLIFIGSTGCSRSLRESGTKIAEQGAKISDQMAQFYEALQRDKVDADELDLFIDAYEEQEDYEADLKTYESTLKNIYKGDEKRARANNVRPPVMPSFELSETEQRGIAATQKIYQALAVRIKLCKAMRDAYASYARLAEYDSSKEIVESVDGLITTVESVGLTTFADPTGGIATNLAKAAIKDLVKELSTLKQNRKLLRESNTLIPILTNLKRLFDAEKVLYGGKTVYLGRKVSGIRGDAAEIFKKAAQLMVKSEVVISSSMITRVLSVYKFSFPEPQVPFTQPYIKAGIIKMIEARAYSIPKTSDDAADGISQSLSGLIKLHRELGEQKPLSLQEVAESSFTVQVLLDQLNQKGISSESVIEILKLLDKGAKK